MFELLYLMRRESSKTVFAIDTKIRVAYTSVTWINAHRVLTIIVEKDEETDDHKGEWA